MKTFAKLVMLLAVLAICMSAQGQGEIAVLVYAKTLNCWECLEVGEDEWDCESGREKGYLVLEVLYDEVTGDIVGILDAEQIVYGRDGREKWFYQVEHDMMIERLLCDGEVIWVIEELDVADYEIWGATILMAKGGRPKMVDIGLGRDEKREVVRQLNGNILGLWHELGDPYEKNMCTMKLRLLQKWTKMANDPDVGGGSFEDTINAIKAMLGERGYVEPEPA